MYGNAEGAIVEIAQRFGRGENIARIDNVHGTDFLRKNIPKGCWEIDSSRIDRPGKIDQIIILISMRKKWTPVKNFDPTTYRIAHISPAFDVWRSRR